MSDLAASSRPTAVCVLGMHRSGTSALAGVLHLLGVDLGRNLIAPGPDNPKGFWEHSQIVSWQMGLLDALGSFSEDFVPLPRGWENQPAVAPYDEYMLALLRAEFNGRNLWGFKDPRTSRTLPLWHQIFDRLGVEARYILVIRNPGEIADSMGARTGCPYNQALLITLGHILEAEYHTRGKRRVLISYDDLLSDWHGQVSRIADTLGIQWPRTPQLVSAQVSQLLDANLRHHKTTVGAEQAARLGGADPGIARWAFGVHSLLAAAAGENAPLDPAAVDEIGDEFRKAAPNLAGWRPRRLKSPVVAKANS